VNSAIGEVFHVTGDAETRRDSKRGIPETHPLNPTRVVDFPPFHPLTYLDSLWTVRRASFRSCLKGAFKAVYLIPPTLGDAALESPLVTRSLLPPVPKILYCSSIMSTILGQRQIPWNVRRDPAFGLRPPAIVFGVGRFLAVSVGFVVCVTFLLGSAHALGEPFQPVVAPSASTDRAVLLRSGAVIQGRIQDVGEKVRITVNHGEILIPKREIKEIAGSTLELYARQRDRLPPGEAEAHLELATWCIEHGLKQEARQELQLVRSLRPDHPMISLAERRIELSDSAIPAFFPREQQKAPPPNAGGFDQTAASAANPLPLPSWLSDAAQAGSTGLQATPSSQDLNRETTPLSIRINDVPNRTVAPLRRSDPSVLLRGLPANTGPDFVRVIQPILSNQCATAGCHGANAPDDRRLLRIPFGRPATRSETAHNLEVVLGWIDFENPGASPLLAVPTRPHGGAAAPIFSGTSARQYRELVDWVFAVTRKDGGENPQPSPDETGMDMPGGIPPELQQATSPAFLPETSSPVVSASAMEGPSAVLPAVAWEAKERSVPRSSADENPKFFPEWFTEHGEHEQSITLESGRILSGSPEDDARITGEGKTSSSTRLPMHRLPGEAAPSTSYQEAPVAEPTGLSTNAISGDRSRSRVVTDESGVQATGDQQPPQVLPFGDQLPPQNNYFYR